MTATPGQPVGLQVKDDRGNLVQVQGEIVQPARTSPLTRQQVQRALSKTGGSPFEMASFEYQAGGDSFLPVSALNALRREALEQLTQERVSNWQRDIVQTHLLMDRTPIPLEDLPTLYVRCADTRLRSALLEAGADVFLYAPEDYTRPSLKEELGTLSHHDYFCLPRQTKDDTLKGLHALVGQEPVNILADNVAQLHLSWPKKVLAGDGIPAWNTQTRLWLKERGCSGHVLTGEVSASEGQALMEDGTLPCLLRVYGRVTAMLLNHCPERVFQGLGGPQSACHLCDTGKGTRGQWLTDSKGARYPLHPVRLPEGCLNHLLFHSPLHLSRRTYGKHWLLEFATETPEEMANITRYYAALKRGHEPEDRDDIPYYLGRLTEGVQ